MAKKTIINSIEGVIPAGKTELTLTLKALSSNVLGCYDRIAGVDYDSDVTVMTFGFFVGSSAVLLEGFASPGAGVAKAVEGKIFAPGHYRPFVKVTGGTAGDKIGLAVFGYITEAPE